MKEKNYKTAVNIWKSISDVSAALTIERPDSEITKKFNSIFLVGPFYFYFLDLSRGEFAYVSPAIKDILGYDSETITVREILANIHPDDMPYFLNFESKAAEFIAQLPPEKTLKYKITYDYRMKNSKGKYVRLLHQVVGFSLSPNGKVALTLGVHTDISHIKTEGWPSLSFIGLEGEPSYFNVDCPMPFKAEKDRFTKREREILKHICKGRKNAEIAELLYVSEHTIKTHRKNILAKAGASSTAELIAMLVKESRI